MLSALYVAGDEAGATRRLGTPNRLLAGVTPWDALCEEGAVDLVAEAARSPAQAWAGP